MLADVLLFMAQRWPVYAAAMAAARREAIRRQLADAVHTGDWDPEALLGDLLAEVPETDEAWELLRRRPTRRTTVEEPIRALAAARLRRAIEAAPEPSDPQAPFRYPALSDDPQALEVDAFRRLYAAPIVTFASGVVPPGAIDLEAGRSPAFQFAHAGKLLETVAEINDLLDAQADPWGAASWWLLPHSSLPLIPADALLLGDPESVLRAARAVAALN